MLTFFHQGFSQIIEDIGVLSTLILSAPHLPTSVITSFWEEIRKSRVERIKSFASWNTRMFLKKNDRKGLHLKNADAAWKSMENVDPDPGAHFNSPAFFKWAHDYDAIEQVSLSPYPPLVNPHRI